MMKRGTKLGAKDDLVRKAIAASAQAEGLSADGVQKAVKELYNEDVAASTIYSILERMENSGELQRKEVEGKTKRKVKAWSRTNVIPF